MNISDFKLHNATTITFLGVFSNKEIVLFFLLPKRFLIRLTGYVVLCVRAHWPNTSIVLMYI